jgi:hypothetical protein
MPCAQHPMGAGKRDWDWAALAAAACIMLSPVALSVTWPDYRLGIRPPSCLDSGPCMLSTLTCLFPLSSLPSFLSFRSRRLLL